MTEYFAQNLPGNAIFCGSTEHNIGYACFLLNLLNDSFWMNISNALLGVCVSMEFVSGAPGFGRHDRKQAK